MLIYYHKFKSINVLIFSVPNNYIYIKKISSKYKDNIIINANFWDSMCMGNHSARLFLKLLEPTWDVKTAKAIQVCG